MKRYHLSEIYRTSKRRRVATHDPHCSRRRSRGCVRWLLRSCQFAVAKYMPNGSGRSTDALVSAVECVAQEAAPDWHLHMGCGEPLRSQWLLNAVFVVQMTTTSTKQRSASIDPECPAYKRNLGTSVTSNGGAS